jgi:hypothetical protein
MSAIPPGASYSLYVFFSYINMSTKLLISLAPSDDYYFRIPESNLFEAARSFARRNRDRQEEIEYSDREEEIDEYAEYVG